MSQSQVQVVAERAREASYSLATATRPQKDAALHAMADALRGGIGRGARPPTPRDVERAEAAGTPATSSTGCGSRRDRIDAMADGLRDVAGLPDPVGEVVRGCTLANGLELRQVRVPFGVVGDDLRGPPQRHRRRRRHLPQVAATRCCCAARRARRRSQRRDRRGAARRARRRRACRRTSVQLVAGRRHDAVEELMRARGLVDVLIPRGGAGLIQQRGRGVDGAGDRDRRRQLPRLRRRRRRPRQGARDRASTPRPSGRASATPPSRCSCTPTWPTTFLPAVVDGPRRTPASPCTATSGVRGRATAS